MQATPINFNYLFITNKPDIARFVEQCGVTRIFIDLESREKVERQGHLDTVISQHCFDDIKAVKSVLASAELLVRLNPTYEFSREEIESAIQKGADIIMLPMCRTINEIKAYGELIGGRAKFIPLVETIAASKIVKEICELDCVDEIHIGLNDLHLEFGLSFMFELIANGYVDDMVKGCTKPFGVGGIARVGQGEVPGEMVMSQHVRLKSSAVILSRAFHLRSISLKELMEKIDLVAEIRKLEIVRKQFEELSGSLHDDMFKKFVHTVNAVVVRKNEKIV